MIRNEAEYQESVRRLHEERQRLAEHQARLEQEGLGADEIKRALDPLRSFHMQLEEEVELYERLKRGDLGELKHLTNLEGLGQLLVALRIAAGLTQRDLADRLGVHESQVSRDERNEYHGITLERANKVIGVLGADIHSEVQLKSLATRESTEQPARAVVVARKGAVRVRPGKSPARARIAKRRVLRQSRAVHSSK